MNFNTTNTKNPLFKTIHREDERNYYETTTTPYISQKKEEKLYLLIVGIEESSDFDLVIQEFYKFGKIREIFNDLENNGNWLIIDFDSNEEVGNAYRNYNKFLLAGNSSRHDKQGIKIQAKIIDEDTKLNYIYSKKPTKDKNMTPKKFQVTGTFNNNTIYSRPGDELHQGSFHQKSNFWKFIDVLFNL
jgi:hypothetical protein